MKPFLILQLRPIDEASNNEFEAFLEYGNLLEGDVHRIRMEENGIPILNLNDYSGVIVGGGPCNVSDNHEEKYDYQKVFEPQLLKLLERIVQTDFPYLGTCYGLGILNAYLGGSVSKDKYSEKVDAVQINISDEGLNDDLLKDIPTSFIAFGGHKEACQNIPNSAVLLASSNTCPYQMIRVKNNIYATQFHPELDLNGILVRIEAYKNHGYFQLSEAEALSEQVKTYDIEYPSVILKGFVQKYMRE